MVFVGVLWSLDNIDQFTIPLFDGAYFQECHVVFVGLEKNIHRLDRNISYGARRFS